MSQDALTTLRLTREIQKTLMAVGVPTVVEFDPTGVQALTLQFETRALVIRAEANELVLEFKEGRHDL